MVTFSFRVELCIINFIEVYDVLYVALHCRHGDMTGHFTDSRLAQQAMIPNGTERKNL